MKTVLLVLLCLLTFNGFSQDEDDTLEMYIQYLLIDYSKWTSEEFFPSEENIELDTLSQVSYNPYINNESLDSILKWRESKGYNHIDVNWDDIDKRMKDMMFYECADVSKAEKANVVLGRFEDPFPDCDCTNSIVEQILDDDIIFGKNTPLKNYMLSNRVKRIELYYYKSNLKNSKNETKDHLLLKIKKRFGLFNVQYEVY